MLTLSGKLFTYFVSVFGGIGILLFGYDQGSLGGLITGPHFTKLFRDPFPEESKEIIVATIVAMFEVGAFFGSMICGWFADRFGRLKAVLAGCIVLSVGAAMQSAAYELGLMISGRIVAGLGIGFLMTTLPILQSELAPPADRGTQECLQWVLNIFGVVVAYWLDYGFSFIEHEVQWRFPIAFQIFFALLLAIGTFILPESPRWLAAKGRDADARVVLMKMHGGKIEGEEAADKELSEIKEAIRIENLQGEPSWGEMFSSKGSNNLRRTVLAMGIQSMQQLCGINVIAYFQVPVFLQAGLDNQTALLVAGINTVFYFFSTFIPVYAIDRWGRRPMLIIGAAGQSICMTIITIFLATSPTKAGYAVPAFVYLYTALFGAAWLSIAWIYPSEIFPTRTRAKGAGLATMANFFFNTLIGLCTLPLQKAMGAYLYVIFAVINFLMVFIIYFFYPETKGKTLEEMDRVFMKDYPSNDEEKKQEYSA
ncbi:uncharacterized protein VTP21DRAFT_8433 [Calcarisporiella thermophila]|uniref:uncharacterized protein n=1 Tax=Calcarisporiella thermophila TaxID=911321 RepID=UPI0037427904